MHNVIVGQDNLLHSMFIGLLANGHLLIEGVPGLAKTLAVSSLAKGINTSYQRLQFTPDLLPADLTGTLMYRQDTGEFVVHKGPIFASIILADEINRTPPKTQSALLEAMQENKVTIGGTTYDIEAPLFVMATQNPIEQEGTYPLPEAQLDRFMFNVIIDYPSFKDELQVVKNNTSNIDINIKKIINRESLLEYQKLVLNIPVSDNLIDFAVKFVHNTRPVNEAAPSITKKYINWGAGPRASSYLVMAAKAKAVLLNKPTPDLDDMISVIKPVLRHRIIPNFNAEAEGIKSDNILDDLLKSVK